MTTKIEVTVPQGADYYVRVETISKSGRVIQHYVDPGGDMTFHIWEGDSVGSIREVKFDSSTSVLRPR